LPSSEGRIRTCGLWVMSGHAAVSHSPTHTADVPGDQPPGDAAVSALPLRFTAWHGGSVTNLVTGPPTLRPHVHPRPQPRLTRDYAILLVTISSRPLWGLPQSLGRLLDSSCSPPGDSVLPRPTHQPSTTSTTTPTPSTACTDRRPPEPMTPNQPTDAARAPCPEPFDRPVAPWCGGRNDKWSQRDGAGVYPAELRERVPRLVAAA